MKGKPSKIPNTADLTPLSIKRRDLCIFVQADPLSGARTAKSLNTPFDGFPGQIVVNIEIVAKEIHYAKGYFRRN